MSEKLVRIAAFNTPVEANLRKAFWPQKASNRAWKTTWPWAWFGITAMRSAA